MRLFPPIPASNPRNCDARHKQLQPDVRRLRVSFEGYKRVQTTNHWGILRIIKIWIIIIMIILHTILCAYCMDSVVLDFITTNMIKHVCMYVPPRTPKKVADFQPLFIWLQCNRLGDSILGSHYSRLRTTDRHCPQEADVS